MNRYVILGGAILIPLCVVLPGCAQDQRNGVIDPRPMVHWLIERNRLTGRGEPRTALPTGNAWDNLTLAFFPGGVGVSWSGTSKTGSPLVFDASGTLVCHPLQYLPTHVTGAAAHDLITAEYTSQGIGFCVYTLGEGPARRTLLGSMIKYAYSTERFPDVWDFDGDGIFEIICRLPVSTLGTQVSLPISDVGEPTADWLITVWSVRGGVPKVVLALSDCEYQGPGGLCDGFYAEGKKIEWHPRTRRFIVPVLPSARVLLNQEM